MSPRACKFLLCKGARAFGLAVLPIYYCAASRFIAFFKYDSGTQKGLRAYINIRYSPFAKCIFADCQFPH
jgi:hypothetical protein